MVDCDLAIYIRSSKESLQSDTGLQQTVAANIFSFILPNRPEVA